jgi:hypothetical protein
MNAWTRREDVHRRNRGAYGVARLGEMGAMEMPAPDNTLPMITELQAMKPDGKGAHEH